MKRLLFLAPLLLAACAPTTFDSHSAPATSSAPTPTLLKGSAPLEAGQTWVIRVNEASVNVQVPTVQNPNPGVYANTDLLGFLQALQGSAPPAVTLNKNEGSLLFVWRDGSNTYLCKITDFTVDPKALQANPKALTYTGQWLLRGAVLGLCTATRL